MGNECFLINNLKYQNQSLILSKVLHACQPILLSLKSDEEGRRKIFLFQLNEERRVQRQFEFLSIRQFVSGSVGNI